MTLIVTSLLPVGICGLIRQLVQAIWSCDETRAGEKRLSFEKEEEGARQKRGIHGISEHTEHL